MQTSSVKVKVCGITRPDDARMAADAGADAIGLNFLAGPRKIDRAVADTILAATPGDIEVWVLLDITSGHLPPDVQEIAAAGRISRVQLYGQLSPDTLARVHALGLTAVAVQHVDGPGFVNNAQACLNQCRPERPDLLLLDAKAPRQLGGTGMTLDWNMIAEQRNAGHMQDWPPIVLAGGLNPDNVASAARIVQPAWVDVCSRVESDTGAPGIKDAAKVRAFVQAAKSVVL